MLLFLITVLLFFLFVLAIPLTLDYKLSWSGSLNGELRFRWLFGLLKKNIPLSSFLQRDKNARNKWSKNKPKRNDRSKNSQKTGSLRQTTLFFHIALRTDIKRRILKLVRSLWLSIDKRDLKLRLRLGLGDPADTGMMWAALGPVSALPINNEKMSVTFEPEFQKNTIEFDSSGEITLIPIQPIWLVVCFLLSPSLWLAFYRNRH